MNNQWFYVAWDVARPTQYLVGGVSVIRDINIAKILSTFSLGQHSQIVKVILS